MKRIILTTGLTVLIVLMAACNKKGTEDPAKDTGPTVTVPAEDTSDEDGKDENEVSVQPTEAPTETPEEILTVEDYFPLLKDTEYAYEGIGNEYASSRVFVDYLDEGKNRIQTRTNNGGTDTVKVIEIKDGKISVIFQEGECYYRENFLDHKAEEPDVLLMEPLVQETRWTLPDGRSRSITNMDVEIQTPSGTYHALEVTTEGEDDLIKDYYAEGIGLVKSIFESGETEITSALSEVIKNSPFTRTVDLYYPDSEGQLNAGQMVLSFHTNDVTRLVLQEAVKESVSQYTGLPLFTTNTKINSLYLGEDHIVYIDFSPEFVSEMNAGSLYESLILQAITNTLGSYYGAEEVYITVDNKPYESGHILMKEGETFRVNMEK